MLAGASNLTIADALVRTLNAFAMTLQLTIMRDKAIPEAAATLEATLATIGPRMPS